MIRDDHLYEELKRRIDFQIEESRHLETQAGRFLRIWLLVMGGLLTVGLSLASGRIDPPSPDRTASAESLAEFLPLVGTNLAGLMLVIVAGISILFLGGAIGRIFVTAPLSMLEVLRLSKMEPTPEVSSNIKREFFRELEEEYYIQLQNNEELLEETRNAWERCHSSITEGVKYMAVSGFTIITLFIAYNEIFALLSFVFISQLAFNSLYRISDNIRPYFIVNWTVDRVYLSMIATSAIAFILIENFNSPDILLALPVLLGLAILLFERQLSEDLIKRLLGRTLGFLLIAFFIMLILVIMVPPIALPLYLEAIFILMISIVLASMHLSLPLMTLYVADKSLTFIQESSGLERIRKVVHKYREAP